MALFHVLLTFLSVFVAASSSSVSSPTNLVDGRVGSMGADGPKPPIWPEQFHAVMFQNRSGNLALVDLYYDFPGGRNLNLIHSQMGARGTLFDIEWNNKTSFYFDPTKGSCKIIHFDVGILRPDWLDGAEYLGNENISGFITRVWTKADFITYYEDEATGHPVRWIFHSSPFQFEVMSWTEGVQGWPEDIWQAPANCFTDDGNDGGVANVALTDHRGLHAFHMLS